MTDQSTIARLPAGTMALSGSPSGGTTAQTVFLRDELALILTLYGRFVAAGEWRDYGIDTDSETATFSIFRRTSEMPIYRIVKTPARAQKQGKWSILGMDGRILKRGHDLGALLHLFDRKRLKSVP